MQLIISFLGFVLLQSLFINGVHFCFEKGNIFHNQFLERNKNKTWSKPLWTCVRCMSSIWGTISYWSVVYPLYGISYFSVLIWIFDMGILISVNWLVYKKT